MLKDGSSHIFFFQYGSLHGLTGVLRDCFKTRKSHKKNFFIVVSQNIDSQPLTKSFAELDLFPDNPSDAVWKFVSNLKHRPYETTLETFSKLTDTILYRAPDTRPPEEMAAELVNSLHESPEIDGYHVVSSPLAPPAPRLPPRPIVRRGAPLSVDQWSMAKDADGRIKDPDNIKRIVFKGGVTHPLRFVVWKYLLGYYPWDATTEDINELQKKRRTEYFQMKNQWTTMTNEQEERFADFRERKSLIEKDVNRTDRTMEFFAGDGNANLKVLNDILMTYVMYNFDLGYVQGMSDLLSPILVVMSNEVDAFWCFVGFMNRVSTNFELDQAGMKSQLSALFGLVHAADRELASYLEQHDSSNMFFCFRWLLVLFKREFSNEQIMTLWEVLWTDLPCPNFHLLISLAILDMEKNILIENSYGFTEILKHINDLSMKIDLDVALSTAEALHDQFSHMSPEHLPLAIRKLLGMAGDELEEKSEGSSSSSECDDSQPISNQHRLDGDGQEKDDEEALYQKGIDQHYL
ncbi:TBC1 domain family member 15 isoform X2 [Nilaparvata lugens]|nr:TBC1 domain family member 15 isoform X2 [Nilaparvata lugens]